MRLTTKGRFAVTAMLDLALRQGNWPGERWQASANDRQKISSYLEQLFGKLRRASWSDSVRGPGGGYCLARSAHEISVAEIIRAVDEPIDAPVRRPRKLPGRTPLHDARPVDQPQRHDFRLPRFR